MSLPRRTYDTLSDAIALSSPSGRMSKRSREAAEKRLREKLFGKDFDPRGTNISQPTEKERDLRQAGRLRELAVRGMSAKKFTREAEHLEKKWNPSRVPAPALRMYRKFHGKAPMETREMTVDSPNRLPKVLIKLGDAHKTDYVSDKVNGGGDGKKNIFTHRHKKGTILCTDAKGKVLYTIGPQLKVTQAGIEN